MPRTSLHFSLLDNAIESLDYAVELLAYDNELEQSAEYKRAILSISHAVELMLKERVRRVHPSLVWNNVDRYPNLDAPTINAETALIRLERIAGVSIAEDDAKLVRSLRKTRNAIEHYSWSISHEEADLIIGASLGFAAFFIKEHLNYDLLGYAERDGGMLSDLVKNSDSFEEAYRKRQFQTRADNGEAIEHCGFCRAALSYLDEGVCPKCGHWNKASFFGQIDEIPF